MEGIAEWRLCGLRQEVEPKIGGADVVCLGDNHGAAIVETRGSAREGEGHQQAQQRENHAVHSTCAGVEHSGVARQPAAPDAPAHLHEHQQQDEQRQAEGNRIFKQRREQVGTSLQNSSRASAMLRARR